MEAHATAAVLAELAAGPGYAQILYMVPRIEIRVPPVSAHMPNSTANESNIDLFEDYKKPHLQSILDRSSELLLIGNSTLNVLAKSSVILCYRVGVCGRDPTHCW